MAKKYDFKLGVTYSFELYCSQVIAGDFENVTVLGILDRETAQLFSSVTTQHSLVYNYLPDGTPNDPDSFTYLKLRTGSGEVTCIAVEWIRDNTIRELKARRLVLEFPNFDPDKLNLLREILNENDMPGYTVTMLD